HGERVESTPASAASPALARDTIGPLLPEGTLEQALDGLCCGFTDQALYLLRTHECDQRALLARAEGLQRILLGVEVDLEDDDLSELRSSSQRVENLVLGLARGAPRR